MITVVENGDEDALPPAIIVERIYILTEEEVPSWFSWRNTLGKWWTEYAADTDFQVIFGHGGGEAALGY